MNLTVTTALFYRTLLSCICMAFFSAGIAQTTDSLQKLAGQTGFFGVSGVVLLPVEKDRQLDSLLWQEQKIIKHTYLGKRVKRILYQRSTDRMLVIVAGKKSLVMNKATAIAEGLFEEKANSKSREKPRYDYKVPEDRYPDSPLYIGITNYVNFYRTNSTDKISSFPTAIVHATGTDDKYEVTVTQPGECLVCFADSATKKINCNYHFLVKRLPGDDLDIYPAVQLGDITGLTATMELLRQQKEIRVGNGFSFEGATVYFSGPAFRDVITVAADTKLIFAKNFIDLCYPGCSVSFENVKIKDKTGNVFGVHPFSIKVIDEGAPEDYYLVSSTATFPGGNEELAAYVNAALKKETFNSTATAVGFLIKVDEAGNIFLPNPYEISGMNAFDKKCFDIIQKGPKWIPAKFREKNITTAIGISLKIQ